MFSALAWTLHNYCNYTQACTLQNILKDHNVVSFSQLNTALLWEWSQISNFYK